MCININSSDYHLFPEVSSKIPLLTLNKFDVIIMINNFMEKVMAQNIATLKDLIQEYRKSKIQSEAEVRSKLIVPLLEILGYPSALRSEEFPVYGFEGRKRLPAKDADFILFSDPNFATYRSFTQTDIEWVQSHSILVVEAKKTNEMPDILGQPMYYTIWTRAVAYLATDGEIIRGYFYNPINADREILDCKVDDLPKIIALWNFSYENLINIKTNDTSQNMLPQLLNTSLENSGDYHVITSDDEINLPEETLDYMRYAMGRNANGLGPLALVSRFLSMTDCYLQNEMRYDIPQYMFDIPREHHDAYLYIDNMVMSLTKGSVFYFYWNEYERYTFENDYLHIDIVYRNNKLKDFEVGYHVLDTRVSDRLANFVMVKKCLHASTITIAVSSDTPRNLSLPLASPKKKWANKAYNLVMLDFWTENLEKMLAIEEYYEISFHLQPVHGEDNLNKLYDAINFVYDGISMNTNCEITLPGGFTNEDFIIEEPILFEEDISIPLPARTIHNYTFIPCKSAFMPCTVHVSGTSSKDIVRVDGCCLYKVAE